MTALGLAGVKGKKKRERTKKKFLSGCCRLAANRTRRMYVERATQNEDLVFYVWAVRVPGVLICDL